MISTSTEQPLLAEHRQQYAETDVPRVNVHTELIGGKKWHGGAVLCTYVAHSCPVWKSDSELQDKCGRAIRTTFSLQSAQISARSSPSSLSSSIAFSQLASSSFLAAPS